MSSASLSTPANRFLTYFFNSIAQQAITGATQRYPPPPSRCQKRVLLSFLKDPILMPHHLRLSFLRLLVFRHLDRLFRLRRSSGAAPYRRRELNRTALYRFLVPLQLVQTGTLHTIPYADSIHYPRTRWVNRSRSHMMILLDVHVFGTS